MPLCPTCCAPWEVDPGGLPTAVWLLGGLMFLEVRAGGCGLCCSLPGLFLQGGCIHSFIQEPHLAPLDSCSGSHSFLWPFLVEGLGRTLMLGKTEGKRRRGQQRMRWLDGITNSMHRSLNKYWETVQGRGVWRAIVHGIPNHRTWPRGWTTDSWRPLRTSASLAPSSKLNSHLCKQLLLPWSTLPVTSTAGTNRRLRSLLLLHTSYCH